MSDELNSQWIVPILTNIIAAIIIFLFWKLIGFGKNQLEKGTIKEKVIGKFKNKANRPTLRFALVICSNLALIIFGWWLMFTKTHNTPKLSLIEIISLILFVAAIFASAFIYILVEWFIYDISKKD